MPRVRGPGTHHRPPVPGAGRRAHRGAEGSPGITGGRRRRPPGVHIGPPAALDRYVDLRELGGRAGISRRCHRAGSPRWPGSPKPPVPRRSPSWPTIGARPHWWRSRPRWNPSPPTKRSRYSTCSWAISCAPRDTARARIDFAASKNSTTRRSCCAARGWRSAKTSPKTMRGVLDELDVSALDAAAKVVGEIARETRRGLPAGTHRSLRHRAAVPAPPAERHPVRLRQLRRP